MHLPLILTCKVVIPFLGCQWPMLLDLNGLIIIVSQLDPIQCGVYWMNSRWLFPYHVFVHEIIWKVSFFKVLVWEWCRLILDLKMVNRNVVVVLVWNIGSGLHLTFQIFILFIWIYIWFIVFLGLGRKRMDIIILNNFRRIFQTRSNSLLIILRTSNIADILFFVRFYLMILAILRI